MKDTFKFDELPKGTERFVLEECIGEGVHAQVFRAKDLETGENVAVKVQIFNDENASIIQDEYRILKNFSDHENLTQFHGIFRNDDEVWFILELCANGSVMDLVRGLISSNRRMAEEHISLIIKEVVKALNYLHENNVMHRDIKGSNVLLTSDGDVKLVDFGLSRVLKSPLGKTYSCLGSPDWMAPEVINMHGNLECNGYDSRADVWALGILALELGNGKSPFCNMHPTRAIFQIASNPPPNLDLPGNWSDTFKDFIDECLVKNPEHRPFMIELLDHPFFDLVPEKYYHLNQELKILYEQYGAAGKQDECRETIIKSNLLKNGYNKPMTEMLVEDLSTLDEINEEAILEILNKRMDIGQSCTYVGDVLLVLNPNEQEDLYVEKQHSEYQFKSRSDSAPHVFAVADSAYQAALHHDRVQHIIFTGESSSGKTTNFLNVIDHLLYLGKSDNINQERIKNGINLIHAFIHASTPSNDYSTRAVFHTEINYGGSGKNTGAHFEVYQIEKWRVSSLDENQPNFHMLYYFYDGIQASGELNKYLLTDDRQCRYLRIPANAKFDSRPRDNPKSNVKKFQKILEILKDFEFTEEEIQSILNTLAAIIILGDIDFIENEEIEIANKECAMKAAQLLKIEEEKFVWSLINSSNLRNNAAHVRDVLANTLYSRVVQYVVNIINIKLSYGRAIFGDKYSIKVLDFYGFESFENNGFSQFLVNCTNEQMQYFYNQAVFAWEELESAEENVACQMLSYYNNKKALDEMLGGFSVLELIEEAAKENKPNQYIIDALKSKSQKFISAESNGFNLNHYAGTVTYDISNMKKANQDLLPIDMVKLLRSTNDVVVKTFFTNKLNRMGNLCISLNEDIHQNNINSKQFSQTAKLYAAGKTFKASSLELMKELSIAASGNGAHFIRCLRSDFTRIPKSFHKELIKQQLRALAVVETAIVRKKGFSHRITFSEFLKRYQFLAFGFDESVLVNKENCRLLLIRLNMENWVIGKSKVFLKYYNEEYLSRLYEKQVKKIIKIQSIVRSYLSKRKMAAKFQKGKRDLEKERDDQAAEQAAVTIQKAYRNYYGRKTGYGTEKIDNDSKKLIRYFYTKWRSRSIYQVLLQYRASQYQDLYNLSQQVHLYNQYVINELNSCKEVDLKAIDKNAQVGTWLGHAKAPVLKLPFRLDNIPYYDTLQMCNFLSGRGINDDEENWDSPFTWNMRESSSISSQDDEEKIKMLLPKLPFIRQPSDFTPLINDIEIETDAKIKKRSNLQVEHLNNINNITTAPANKDFEYIKAPVLKKTPKTKPKDDYVNPITELESIGRRKSSGDEDDPPFNFQAMLRKTNYRRDFDEQSNDDKESNKKEDYIENNYQENNKENVNVKESKKAPLEKSRVSFDEVHICTELAPGIFLEGVVIDL
ncbi:hypothetical protein RN001_007392 [Aquatica leii]|uniref:non-specific serine/threonine protein kinase n=1 Tax=Aquatica leii TaxID=1421715 RepID=A0AAN7PD16_9COLE|nr:hypothetical protein RN001_007392 [Aquatica leii]